MEERPPPAAATHFSDRAHGLGDPVDKGTQRQPRGGHSCTQKLLFNPVSARPLSPPYQSVPNTTTHPWHLAQTVCPGKPAGTPHCSPCTWAAGSPSAGLCGAW